MASPTDDEAYEQAREAYRSRLREYGDALRNGDARARGHLANAEALWNSLRDYGRDEDRAPEMHVVLAFSTAVDAGDPIEAERLYNAMSDEYKASADASDSLDPGSVKIWLRP